MKIVDIKTFKKLITTDNRFKYGRIASLDVGSKRIGVACTDEIRFTINPVITLERKTPRMHPESIEKLSKQLQAIINEKNITGLVVGFPLTQENEITPLCKEIVTMCQRLSCHYKSPIPIPPTMQAEEDLNLLCTFWDERNSSVGSRALSRSMSDKLSVAKKYKDTFAACLILQGFVENVLV